MIVGICRFSLLGRGDWKATRKKPQADIKAMADARAAMLFAPERMEARLATFEHLTLASLKAQTDPEFTFVVLASSLMPEIYQDRLEALCAQVPQVTLRYFPLMPVIDAQNAVFRELGLSYADTLQFRLDDDDCVCVDFIEVLRRNTVGLMATSEPFVASMRGVMLCAVKGRNAGVYDWPISYYSAGAAMRNQKGSIFRYGHYKMARLFSSLTIPRRMALVTHNSTNDTSLPTDRQLRRGEMTRMTPDQIATAQARFFPFLTEAGKEICGLTAAMAQADRPDLADATDMADTTDMAATA